MKRWENCNGVERDIYVVDLAIGRKININVSFFHYNFHLSSYACLCLYYIFKTILFIQYFSRCFSSLLYFLANVQLNYGILEIFLPIENNNLANTSFLSLYFIFFSRFTLNYIFFHKFFQNNNIDLWVPLCGSISILFIFTI